MRRRLQWGLAALALTAGPPSLAGAAAGDDELVPVPNVQVYKLKRYAFNRVGESIDQMAALGCLGGQPGVIRARRTKGDVAAAVFTAGLYTPVHVTIDCTQATAGR